MLSLTCFTAETAVQCCETMQSMHKKSAALPSEDREMQGASDFMSVLSGTLHNATTLFGPMERWAWFQLLRSEGDGGIYFI